MSILRSRKVEVVFAAALLLLFSLTVYKVHATPVTISMQTEPMSDTVAVRLPVDLDSENYELWKLASAIEEVTKDKTLILYVAGNGGDVNVTTALLNQLIRHESKVRIIVDGDVFSGHAYLALSIKNTTFLGAGSLMMHTSSVIDLDCSRLVGKKDRGQDMVKKCEDYKSNSLAANIAIIKKLHLLTAKERELVISGHDVYITFDELRKRQANGSE